MNAKELLKKEVHELPQHIKRRLKAFYCGSEFLKFTKAKGLIEKKARPLMGKSVSSNSVYDNFMGIEIYLDEGIPEKRCIGVDGNGNFLFSLSVGK